MEFTSQSGAKVKISPADFEDAMDLQSAILKEASKAEFSLDGVDLKSDIDLAGLIKAGMSVAASKDVREILFKCLVRCTYDGQKITKATFEPFEARKDYYEIVIACLKENLSPFFEGLLSKLSPFLGQLKQAENQKSQ
jgi:hypothetical protein